MNNAKEDPRSHRGLLSICRVAVWAAVSVGATLAMGAEDGPAPPPGVLLWPDGAPGAVGDTADDKPAVHIHLAPADKAVGTAAVICPGGGYGGVMMSYEGHEVARWFNSFGVTALVLHYRTAPRYRHPAPLQDVQRAIRFVRANAKRLRVVSNRIGVVGFSAGGHLAATAGVKFDPGDSEAADVMDRQSSRPDFLILGYPVITLTGPFAHRGSRSNLLGSDASEALAESLSVEKHVTAETPPAFLLHTNEDRAVAAENSLMLFAALRKAGVPAELHIYREGPHGVGLNRHPATVGWPDQAKLWMARLGLLGKANK